MNGGHDCESWIDAWKWYEVSCIMLLGNNLFYGVLVTCYINNNNKVYIITFN